MRYLFASKVEEGSFPPFHYPTLHAQLQVAFSPICIHWLPAPIPYAPRPEAPLPKVGLSLGDQLVITIKHMDRLGHPWSHVIRHPVFGTGCWSCLTIEVLQGLRFPQQHCPPPYPFSILHAQSAMERLSTQRTT